MMVIKINCFDNSEEIGTSFPNYGLENYKIMCPPNPDPYTFLYGRIQSNKFISSSLPLKLVDL